MSLSLSELTGLRGFLNIFVYIQGSVIEPPPHPTPAPPPPAPQTHTLNSESNNLTKRESLICVTQRQWKTHRSTYIKVYVFIHILREMKYQYAWGWVGVFRKQIYFPKGNWLDLSEK